jgi:hypothetical protein
MGELLPRAERQGAEWQKRREEMRVSRAEPTDLDALARAAFAAWRMEQLGDKAGAAKEFEKLRDKAVGDPGGRYWAVYAAARMKVNKESKQENDAGKKAVRDRVASVLGVVEKAKKSGYSTELPALWVEMHDVKTLYADVDGMSTEVQDAQTAMKDIDDLKAKGG